MFVFQADKSNRHIDLQADKSNRHFVLQADKSKSRGYMFVEYESHKAAAVARRKLSQGEIFF